MAMIHGPSFATAFQIRYPAKRGQKSGLYCPAFPKFFQFDPKSYRLSQKNNRLSEFYR
jgi:hypothetical protein